MSKLIRVVCLLAISACFIANPASAQIGLEWETEHVSVLAIADISSHQGLEYIGITVFGEIGIYRLTDATLLEPIPSPFNAPQTQFTLWDLDSDGLAEILCTLETFPSTAVGLLDLSGKLDRVWPDQTIMGLVDSIDQMNLNSNEPHALVLDARDLLIMSSQTGQILFDSSTDPGVENGYTVESYLIDDFDTDGYEEILASMIGGDHTQRQSILVGDTSVSTGTQQLSGQGLVFLGQNRPNPASGPTSIEFALGEEGPVRLRVFDASGRLVRTLVNQHMSAGSYSRTWDGRDAAGSSVASGIYFYELNVRGQRQTRKVVQIR